MDYFKAMALSGANYREFSKAFSSTCRALPREAAKHLCDIHDQLVARYGFEGAYSRLNNRSVAQIFAEYQPDAEKPIASGEIGGMRYRLYASPSESPDGENAADE